MSLLSSLKRALMGESAEPQMLDHIAVADSAADWRDAKVIEAAARFGRQFKAGPSTVPREVLVGGREIVTVDAGQPAPKMQRKT